MNLFWNMFVFVKYWMKMISNIWKCIKYIIAVVSSLYPRAFIPIWQSAELCEVSPEKTLPTNSFLWQQSVHFL